MPFMMNSTHKKLLLFLFALLLAIGIGVYAIKPMFEKPTEEVPNDIPPLTMFTGTTVCLPHRDTDGPQTMECAFGLHTDDGKYYALDLNLELSGNVETTKRVTVEGLFIPIEAISTDMWQKYDVEGIMQVVTLTELE